MARIKISARAHTSGRRIYTGKTPDKAMVVQPDGQRTTLVEGKLAAECPVCGHLVRAIINGTVAQAGGTGRQNEKLRRGEPILGKHSQSGTKNRPGDYVYCLGTYERARGAKTYKVDA